VKRLAQYSTIIRFDSERVEISTSLFLSVSGLVLLIIKSELKFLCTSLLYVVWMT
jgi:hypothetical protein